MALTAATASYVVDETISTLAFDDFIQEQPVLPVLYDQRPSDKPDEEGGSMSGLGDLSLKTELAEPDVDEPIQQFRTKHIHKVRALQVKISRELVDDALFPFLSEFAPKLGESAMRTNEKLAAGPFNEAFASSTYLSEGGLTLASGAHVNVDAGNSQSNSGTTAFGWAAVGATRKLMRDYTDYRGNVVSGIPDLLLVTPADELEAFEVVQSGGDPTSANNKINVHQGKFGVVVWDYLTNSGDWFMIRQKLMKQNLLWWWRKVPEIMGDGSLMKGMRSVGLYQRTVNGIRDWRWVYCHNA